MQDTLTTSSLPSITGIKIAKINTSFSKFGKIVCIMVFLVRVKAYNFDLIFLRGLSGINSDGRDFFFLLPCLFSFLFIELFFYIFFLAKFIMSSFGEVDFKSLFFNFSGQKEFLLLKH